MPAEKIVNIQPLPRQLAENIVTRHDQDMSQNFPKFAFAT